MRYARCRRSLGWDHEDLLVHRRIAEWDRAADPKAFALGGSDLVAHPLPDQLAFELPANERVRIAPEVQAVFLRRRHQPRRSPLADRVGKEAHPLRL
jgi:hypothetical protein